MTNIITKSMNASRALRTAALAFALAALACKKGSTSNGDVAQRWKPAAPGTIAGAPIAAVQQALASKLAGARPAPLDEDQWSHVQHVYKLYAGVPLWMDQEGVANGRAEALTQALINGDGDALRLDAYPIGALATALAALKQTKTPTADQVAQADLLLTSAFTALGEDLLTGQVNPKEMSQDWHIDPQEEHVDSALVRSLRDPDLAAAIGRMRPQDEDYANLRKDLVTYRALTQKGGWNPVPSGKATTPGQPDAPARLEALRARLSMEGYQVPATAGALYDRPLAALVAQFQSRHGIAVDSTLGPETISSLNLSAEYRLGQVAANLERYRWLPRSLGERYILVNVPAFRLEAYDKGEKALEMKVIVGQEYEGKNTPVFSDTMQYVVFRPYWNITPDIQAKEVGPKIAADPGYLDRENLEYYKDGGATRIRQKPGPKNSLGLVKFLFPNSFNIYLHDTPADNLFEKDVRAFSHGCIRLEKPEEMAQFVLGWDANQVREAMQNGPDNKSVTLKQTIPVYIAYFTAYTRDGQLYFGNDLYDRDAALVKKVAGGATTNAQTAEAVNALKRIAER
ncbi:MAG: ErfK/YbiS/YcfS/YnhG family protein [Gemmatimonadetes bacterium]|nr:ErfK/YbiS/YcfS/YnhG family protein [Gemmatimonadota bacterium]